MEFKKSQVIWTWLKRIFPPLLGAAGGFLYYSFVGCTSGTCPITSNPWSSTVVGIIIGAAFIPKTSTKKRETS